MATTQRFRLYDEYSDGLITAHEAMRDAVLLLESISIATAPATVRHIVADVASMLAAMYNRKETT